MKLYSLIIALLCSQFLQSQKLDIDKLYYRIYEYNNALQYKKSQDTLSQLLEKDNITAQDHIELNILLSLTYKRLQDYTSVNYYLSKAKQIAKQNNIVSYYNIIDAQFAFSYFDIQDYKKADDIMKQIAGQKYQYLPEDDIAKLLMQKGYISYLGKNFDKAKEYYDRSAVLMKKSNDCDLPIVYGKFVQLYFAWNKEKQALDYYKIGTEKARQYKILKYAVYLAEVMMNTYKDKKDAANALKFSQKYDSLNAIYNPAKNLQDLHINRETAALDSEQKIKKSRWQIIVGYTIGIFLLLLVMLFIVRYTFGLRNKNKKNTQTIEEMKQILADYETEKKLSMVQKDQLTTKQLGMIEMIKDGKSNKEIANHFRISESTVKYHIKIIYEILNIKKRGELKRII